MRPALVAYTNVKSPPLDELEELELEEELEVEELEDDELDEDELDEDELDEDELELELESPLAEQEMIVPLESSPVPINPILTAPPGSTIPFQPRSVAV